jgi:outer membrane receptor protein involved in Fe transport
VSWQVSYSYIQATYRTPLILNSPSNSSAAPVSCPTCADIRVQPGDRMPGVPRHILKVDLDYVPSDRWNAGINLIAQTSTYARGDENNQDVNGPVPGYALVNLSGQYQLTERLQLYAKVDNLFDRLYSTFGTLGANAFNLPGHAFNPNPAGWTPAQYRSVGPGRGIWIGVSYRIGA